MSVLIKGMDMPKEKALCIVLRPTGQLFVDHGCYWNEYEAVELPTPHGRLIDAEAFIKVLNACKYSVEKATMRQVTYNAAISDVCRNIDRLPAIIEAEKEKE